MISLRYTNKTENSSPVILKPWQVFITANNSVLTQIDKKDIKDYSFYPLWIKRKFLDKDTSVVQELYHLYEIHKQYNTLELVGIKGEIFILCIKRILDNSIIGGQDVYRQRPNC